MRLSTNLSVLTTAWVVALVAAQASTAAPLAFLQRDAAEQEAAAPADAATVQQQTHVSSFSSESLNPKRWFTKWFGESRDETIPEFTEPPRDPMAGFVYQAPTAEGQRLAMRDATPADEADDGSLPALPPRRDASEELTREVVARSQSLEARDDVEAARRTLVDHLMEYRYDVRVLRALGHLEDRAGDLAQAETHYRQALGAEPSSVSAKNDLGLCLARQGRLEASHAALRDAVQARPEKPLYRNNIATVLVELDRTSEAFMHLQSVYPPPTAHYNLGQLCARAGRVDEAQYNFRKALAMDPSMTAAAQALAKLSAAPPTQEAPQEPASEQPVAEQPVAEESVAEEPVADEPAVEEVAMAPEATQAAAEAPLHGAPVALEPTPHDEPAGAPSFPRLLPPVVDR